MISGKSITASVGELLIQHGFQPLFEYPLPNGRRLDVAFMGKSGRLGGVEVKAAERDFNRDLKWADAMNACFIFYFAVPVGFNTDLIHPGIRLIKSNGETAWFSRKMGRGLARPTAETPHGKLYAVKPPHVAFDVPRHKMDTPEILARLRRDARTR